MVPSRPVGITILAMLEILGGAMAVVFGISLFYARLVIALVIAPFMLPFGTVTLAVGYGVWTGKIWGWVSTICVTIIGAALAVLFYGYEGSALRMALATGLILISGILILWYLWRPHVRAYFQKEIPLTL